MQRFTLPRDIYHGYGSMEILKNLTGKRAIICTGGGSSRRNGSLGKAEAYLKEAGMEVKIYEGIESDPSVETVLKGAKVLIGSSPLAAAPPLMPQKPCGSNMSTHPSPLMKCARSLDSPN